MPLDVAFVVRRTEGGDECGFLGGYRGVCVLVGEVWVVVEQFLFDGLQLGEVVFFVRGGCGDVDFAVDLPVGVVSAERVL